MAAAPVTAAATTKHTGKPVILRLPKPRWSKPAQLLASAPVDLLAPTLALSPNGTLAVGSGTDDIDDPANSSAELVVAHRGRHSIVALPGAQQALALGYIAGKLVVLAGSSPAGLACCSQADVELLAGGRLSAPAPLVSGLAGAVFAQFVPERGGAVLALANPNGVFVARAGRSARFGTARRLTGPTTSPPEMAATALAGGGALVAFTEPVPGMPEQYAGQAIYYATAGPGGVPHADRIAFVVPPGHSVDSLALAPRGTAATLVWSESWFDGTGGYHSRVFAVDLGGRLRPRALSGTATLASEATLSGTAAGQQVVSWQSCSPVTAACTAQAVLRPSGQAFGRVQQLGSLDATEVPVAAEAPAGGALVAWVQNGNVLARWAAPGAGRFSSGAVLARSGDAANPALGFGSGGGAALSWIAGTDRQRLLAATFRP